MTLIAAFRCPKGGILLCADREENDGWNKREINKINRIHGLSDCEVFIAGAGPSGAIIRAYADISESLEKANADHRNIWLDHRDLIETSLKALYEKHPENMNVDGGMSLLLIVAPRAEGAVPLLYRTELAMMIPESVYAAYGSGKATADYMAGRLYEHGRLDKGSTAILAAFIFRETQRNAAGVGLGAEMVFIHEGDKSLQFIPPDSVKEIERGIPSLSDALWGYWKEHATVPKAVVE